MGRNSGGAGRSSVARLNPSVVEGINRLTPGAKNRLLGLSQSLKGRTFTGHTDNNIGDIGVLKNLEQQGFIELKSGINPNASTAGFRGQRFGTRITPTPKFREGVRTLKTMNKARGERLLLERGLR